MNFRHLRRIVTHLLSELLEIRPYDLGIYLVTEAEITRLNQEYLVHRGPTDVITFDYSDAPAFASPGGGVMLRGEIFICVAEAVIQARRFRTNWQSELVRYLIHGVLHLLGYDDLGPTQRRKMKQEEDRQMGFVEKEFDFRKLSKRSS